MRVLLTGLYINVYGHLRFTHLQWNPTNLVTNGPPNSGRINGVAVLKGFFR